MDKINGILNSDTVSFADFSSHDGEVVSIRGYIHRIREMTGFSFVIIRTAKDTIQCVYAPEFSDYRWDEKLCEEACVKVTGKVVSSKDAKGNDRYELQIHDIQILSLPAEGLPIVINKKQLDNIQLSTVLDLRPLSASTICIPRFVTWISIPLLCSAPPLPRVVPGGCCRSIGRFPRCRWPGRTEPFTACFPGRMLPAIIWRW